MAAVFFHILKKRKNAWLYGGSGPREREPVGSKARNEEEREIMEGVLQKRGARVGDAWNDRWVVLCKKELFYKYWDRASDSQGAIIDRIPLTDIEVVVEEEKGRSEVNIPVCESRRDLVTQQSDAAFMILTKVEGSKEGRRYRFQAASTNEMHGWMHAITHAIDTMPVERVSDFQKVRMWAKKVFNSAKFQILVATAIMLNFVCNAVEAEVLPMEGDKADRILQTFDFVFVALFTAELGLNLFANLWSDFVMDLWNYFDSFVVIISLVSVFANNNPGLNVLRMVRAFRVFRLFRQLKSLGQIIRAINQSLPAVGNAFFLVLLMTSIYAIMGVSFFRGIFPQYFDSFSISMYTMFQIMTFDDSGEVTIDLMDLYDTAGSRALVALFTISFQLFVGFILLNIVMAVLLDKFTEASENSKREDSEEATKAFMETSSVLDPVLEQLSKLHTDLMLQERIRELFHFIDEDMSGLIDFDEMRNGFKRLDCDPPIDFTRENFESEILSRGLALQGDIMDIQCFKTYVNLQLKEFVQKCMARAAGEVKPDEKLKIILRSLQQTAMVTCASQEMVLECDGKIGKLAESISETREKVRALKERGYSSMVHEVRAISVDADRHHLRAFGMPTDTGSANDATAAVPYKTDDQMPDDSQNSHSNLLEGVDTKSPEALAHSVAPTATIEAVYPNRQSDNSQLTQGGTVRTISPSLVTPQMSPLANSALSHSQIQPAALETPASLLAAFTPAAAHKQSNVSDGLNNAAHTPFSPVDVLDIRGLNARVDAMQMRLISTIQQAKAARERTSTVFGRRQDSPGSQDGASLSRKDDDTARRTTANS